LFRSAHSVTTETIRGTAVGRLPEIGFTYVIATLGLLLPAIGAAAVAVFGIAVVTLFISFQNSVTALLLHLGNALRAAAVAVARVAVVTLLLTDPDEPVSATRVSAYRRRSVGTAVSGVVIAVVTFLTDLDHPISASGFDFQLTERAAAVAVARVAVVTRFAAFDDAISAHSLLFFVWKIRHQRTPSAGEDHD
jgi:hypothetical protein